MANPDGRDAKGGAAIPSASYAWRSSDGRWYPAIVNDDGELLVMATIGDIGLPTDDITGALQVIDTFHHEIHEGETFIASHLDINLADNGTLILHLAPGPTFSHLVFSGACGGDATVELMENPTITGGAAVNERNMKRTAAEPGDTVVLEDPTINNPGTMILDALIAGGTGGNAAGGFLGLREQSEFILDPDKTYAVRLTNIAGNTKAASLIVQWYEESDN